MADILNGIQSKQDAREAAARIVDQAIEQQETQKFNLKEALGAIAEHSPMDGGFEEFATMLALPDEHFAVLAPIFVMELEKSYGKVNNQLELVQAMNAVGLHSEDVYTEYTNLCNQLDEQLGEILTPPKRDFLKRILGCTYNAIAEADGVGKKKILIPIEYCNKDAKMPEYAHITDAGMDVYALEDITINPGETKMIPLGIKVALPAGYELQVRPKSGRCLRTKLRVANTPGTIDAGYRDEICVLIDNIEPFIKNAKITPEGYITEVEYGSSYTIGKGEKFAQLVLNEIPKAVFYEVNDIDTIENDGRDGGFGSTGIK